MTRRSKLDDAFPVPIIDDYNFTIHVETTAKSTYRYELFDSQGNNLHNEDHIP